MPVTCWTFKCYCAENMHYSLSPVLSLWTYIFPYVLQRKSQLCKIRITQWVKSLSSRHFTITLYLFQPSHLLGSATSSCDLMFCCQALVNLPSILREKDWKVTSLATFWCLSSSHAGADPRTTRLDPRAWHLKTKQVFFQIENPQASASLGIKPCRLLKLWSIVDPNFL